MSNGSLTREQFNHAIDRFVKKCQVINENWHACHVEVGFTHMICLPLGGQLQMQHSYQIDLSIPQNDPGQRYLAKRQIVVTKTENKTKFEDLPADAEENLEENAGFDSSEYSRNTDQKMLTFEYHVVYSSSYSVPVLYFSAWTQDGKTLSLDDIWKQVPDIHQEFLNYDKWSFLTQQEHPLLHRPYFLVHPCHTADMMTQLLKSTSAYETDFSCYLTTWLSAVGPTVGIRLPLQFAMPQDKLQQQRN